jgi:hypothetical protein
MQTENSKTEGVYTYYDWKHESVAITFYLSGKAVVYSLQGKKTFMETQNPETIELLKNDPDKVLIKIYKENFDWIQKQYRNTLENFKEL